MENLKFILVSLIVLVAVVFVGYWAVKTIEPGSVHVDKQKEKELEDQNAELAKQVADLQSQVATLQATQVEQTTQAQQNPPATTGVGLDEKPIVKTPTTTTSKYQSLINDLQKLANDKVYMKVGSQGTRVGTVETFLNAYNKTTKKIDNDYGAGLKTAVASFQKSQGLTADGTTGPTTYLKMIAWLKKQG